MWCRGVFRVFCGDVNTHVKVESQISKTLQWSNQNCKICSKVRKCEAHHLQRKM